MDFISFVSISVHKGLIDMDSRLGIRHAKHSWCLSGHNNIKIAEALAPLAHQSLIFPPPQTLQEKLSPTCHIWEAAT